MCLASLAGKLELEQVLSEGPGVCHIRAALVGQLELEQVSAERILGHAVPPCWDG